MNPTKTLLICMACATAVFATACLRQDRRTITVAVPGLKSADCFRILQDAIKGVDGIEQAQPNFEQRTVAITYNAMKLGIRNIEFVIAGAGFNANDTAAPQATRDALPEGCR